MNFILFQLTQKIFRIVSSVIDKIINNVSLDLVVDDIKINHWLHTQRDKYRNGKIGKEEIEKLEQLGIRWEMNDSQWDKSYAHARDYFMANHDLNVPQKFVCDDGFKLGVWLSNLRTKYRTGQLRSDRIEMLENIGMIWNIETLHFETEISHAKAYLEKFGNLDIPKDFVCEDGYRLGVWLRTVRSSYNSGQLSKRRIQELENLGIVWNPLKEAWDNGYAHAIEYYATHNGCVAPANYVCEDGYKLGQWIRRQKKRLKDGKIDSETRRLLSNIGIE